MKIRLGFVSNSSSSSFICQVTGEVYSGYDASLSDACMYCCAVGHEFGEDFLIDVDDVDQLISCLVDDKVAYANEYNPDHPSFAHKIRDEQHRTYFVKRYHTILEDAAEQRVWLTEQTFEHVDDLLERYFDKYGEYGSLRYEVPSIMCPICSVAHLRDQDLLAWLLADQGLDRNDLVNKLKQRHSTLSSLRREVDRKRSNEASRPGFDLEHS